MDHASTLYVTDLDGTLLNRSDQISEFSIRSIQAMVEEGMHFTYATARSLSSARIATKGLTAGIPVIVYNGAFIRNAVTGETLSSTHFSSPEKRQVMQILAEQQIYPLVYSHIEGIEKVSWVAAKENEGMKRYLGLRRGDKRMTPLATQEKLYDGEVFYFTCIGERKELLPVYEALHGHPSYNCILQQELYREEYWCEIMPKQATKANAILTLKDLLHCERIISFGDAVNDIPMFEVSDECYAVQNAVPALKERATAVIKSNEEDGVVRWLLEHRQK